MMRFRHAPTTVRLLAPALVSLLGCATTPAPRQPSTRVVHLQPPSNQIPSARRPVEARPFAIVPTTQIEPCVFRGSLYTSGKLYSQATGGTAIVELSSSNPVQLERLELPTVRGGRVKVSVAFPIEIEAYMDENEKVVETDKRLDIVPGHAWFDPNTPLHASLRSNGTAELHKQFSEGTSPPEFVTTVPCTDLTLQQTYFHKPDLSGDGVDLRAPRIPIHESAGGREVLALPGRNNDDSYYVRSSEKKPGWLLIEGNEEFHFKGWVATSLVNSEPGFGWIGLLKGPGVTHQVTKAIPLRLEATDAAPVIAKAAKGAEILMGPGPSGYRTIGFGMGVSTSFFAREVDLHGAVQLAEGVEAGEPESPEAQEEAPSVNAESVPPEVPWTPMPPPAVIRPPLIEKTWDLVEVPIHASLEKGMRLMQKGDWAAASKALSIAVAGLSEKDFEAKIIGNALLGRACDRNGDEPCAKSAYTKVLDVAKNSKAKIEAAIALHGDAATTMVARLMYAQGEALFYKAEQKRKAAEAITFPLYRGSGDKDDVFQHIDTKVIDWIKKKRPVVEETEQAYGEILALKPAPPPAWIVLAAGRKGDMWSAFVYELQTLPPMPSEWSGTGTVPGTELTYEELRTEFRTKLGAASAPVRQHAAEAYESCRDQAKEHGVAAAEGKRCAERLTAMGVTP